MVSMTDSIARELSIRGLNSLTFKSESLTVAYIITLCLQNDLE